MKRTIRTMIATTLTIMTIVSFGKTHTMTSSQYHLMICKIDNNIVGTWEKSTTNRLAGHLVYCQFNANGTFVSFEKVQSVCRITGKGRWYIENGAIFIVHGAEKSVPVMYEAAGNQLTFGDQVIYTKSSLTFACK